MQSNEEEGERFLGEIKKKLALMGVGDSHYPPVRKILNIQLNSKLEQ